MSNKYTLSADEIVPITDTPGYCYATDDITVKGKPVGYMYRESPDRPEDSGWRFFSGLETDEEANDPDRLGIFSLNTVANYDRDIVSLLNSDFGTAFARDASGKLVEELFSQE